MEKCVFERHFDDDDQNILAPLIYCHDPGRTVLREPNKHSGYFNNAEEFSIDVLLNTFNTTAKKRVSRNDRLIFISR